MGVWSSTARDTWYNIRTSLRWEYQQFILPKKDVHIYSQHFGGVSAKLLDPSSGIFSKASRVSLCYGITLIQLLTGQSCYTYKLYYYLSYLHNEFSKLSVNDLKKNSNSITKLTRWWNFNKSYIYDYINIENAIVKNILEINLINWIFLKNSMWYVWWFWHVIICNTQFIFKIVWLLKHTHVFKITNQLSSQI